MRLILNTLFVIQDYASVDEKHMFHLQLSQQDVQSLKLMRLDSFITEKEGILSQVQVNLSTTIARIFDYYIGEHIVARHDAPHLIVVMIGLWMAKKWLQQHCTIPSSYDRITQSIDDILFAIIPAIYEDIKDNNSHYVAEVKALLNSLLLLHC